MHCHENQTNCHVPTNIFNYYCCCCSNEGGTKPSTGNPIGTIIAYPSATIPADYLECDGAAIEREKYQELFDILGEIYGAGDGNTTFNLPDLRGEFIRGLDNGRGIDSGRVLGSKQKGTLATYDSIYNDKTAKHLATIAALGPTNYDSSAAKQNVGFDEIKLEDYTNTGITIQSASDSGTSFVLGENNLGATRPHNVAMIYCIKAK